MISYQRKTIDLKSPGSFLKGNHDNVPNLFEEAKRTITQANEIKQSQVWESREDLLGALKDAGLTYSKQICGHEVPKSAVVQKRHTKKGMTYYIHTNLTFMGKEINLVPNGHFTEEDDDKKIIAVMKDAERVRDEALQLFASREWEDVDSVINELVKVGLKRVNGTKKLEVRKNANENHQEFIKSVKENDGTRSTVEETTIAEESFRYSEETQEFCSKYAEFFESGNIYETEEGNAFAGV
eukprot:scaffold11577_cov64-Cyclotella_meneghiniana.AAC.1